jgi:DNA-binding transcriptional ArsR family regulator
VNAAAATPSTIDRTFTALADPTRRAVVDLLRQRPRRAGELAEAFAMSAPAMSRHLRVLRKTGLVVEDALDDDARVRLYRLRAEPFTELRHWLDEVESFWSDQLSAFAEHAARTRRPSPPAPATTMTATPPPPKPPRPRKPHRRR